MTRRVNKNTREKPPEIRVCIILIVWMRRRAGKRYRFYRRYGRFNRATKTRRLGSIMEIVQRSTTCIPLRRDFARVMKRTSEKRRSTERRIEDEYETSTILGVPPRVATSLLYSWTSVHFESNLGKPTQHLYRIRGTAETTHR